jgi:hypothetical protein
MHRRLTPVVAALFVVIAVSCLRMPTARAQGYDPDQAPIQGHVMGGYSATSGNTSDNLQGGWIFDGGVTFWPQDGPLEMLVRRRAMATRSDPATLRLLAGDGRITVLVHRPRESAIFIFVYRECH